jgi:hypothetical protein
VFPQEILRNRINYAVIGVLAVFLRIDNQLLPNNDAKETLI